MNIVVDTNVFISALIKDSITRKIIFNFDDRLLFPEPEFDEIEKHKDEILEKSGLSEGEFYILLLGLLKHVEIIKAEDILSYKKEALKIMGKIDKDDVVFIATALAFKCPIWSDDVHFQKQNKVKILTTPDIIKLIK